MNGKVSVVLPSYKPDEKLISCVDGLEAAGFDDIIVVDDGGGSQYRQIFDVLRERAACTVLVHPENRGKGAALKTAFKWYLENRSGAGVVTADGDGQHLPADVMACADKMVQDEMIVLGVRDFSKPDVPERSRKGNAITSGVFRLFVRMNVSDTQTGLRAFPTQVLDTMCRVSGDRYEYETNMLLCMKKDGLPFEEVEISTVYINENETSHFRPVRDSARIYGLIIKYLLSACFLKFVGSSLLCYLIDTAIFAGLYSALMPLFSRQTGALSDLIHTACAFFGARLASSLVNFFLNSRIFRSTVSVKKAMLRYYLLAVSILIVGSGAVYLINMGLSHMPAVSSWMASGGDGAQTLIHSLVKLPVDLGLFLAGYNIQRKYVFKREGTA